MFVIVNFMMLLIFILKSRGILSNSYSLHNEDFVAAQHRKYSVRDIVRS